MPGSGSIASGVTGWAVDAAQLGAQSRRIPRA